MTTIVQSQTVTDIDGNIYGTVTIGTQVWMSENIKVTHYQNGDIIPSVTDGTIWSSLEEGARAYYDNDSALHAPVYGALYNGYAAIDNRNICPTAWHVASDTDWNILEVYLDPSTDTTIIGWVGTNIGRLLKEEGNSHWYENAYALDLAGFTALPAGVFDSSGSFGGISYYSDWWTSTTDFPGGGHIRFLSYDNDKINRTERNHKTGYSVRCVRDEAATQINENNNNKRIKIYPNPCSEIINIELSENEAENEIQIISITGQIIYSQNTVNGINTVNTSQLKSGIYFLRLKNSGKYCKFVIEK